MIAILELKYKQCDILKEQETKLLERINALCQLVNCQLDESKKLCPEVCNSEFELQWRHLHNLIISKYEFKRDFGKFTFLESNP